MTKPSNASGKRRNKNKKTRRKSFKGIESLEDRRVLATFTVTNLGDGAVAASGDLPGTLRQAVYDANNLPGADEIVFDIGMGSFLPLTDGELSVTDSVDITGPGRFELTISGSGASRIFNVDDASMAAIDVTISGMTLTGGSTASDGGAIRSTENLEVSDAFLVANTAGGSGGAIAVVDGDLLEVVIADSTVSGNAAIEGGGVAVKALGANVTVSDSQFIGNVVSGVGGGLMVATETGNTDVANALVAGNDAGDDGGGIYLKSDDVSSNSLDRLVVSGNQSNSRGGGLFVSNALEASTVITNSQVTGNQASEGGGIYAANGISFAGGGSTEIYRSNVDSNTADANGGGVFAINAEGGQTDIVQSSITGNEAADNGGGLKTESRRYGSYYYYYQPYVYIEYDPETYTGGYGYGPYGPYYYYNVGQPGKTTVQQATVSGNTAGNDGGGIHTDGYSFGSSAYAYGSYDVTLEIENSTVSGNSASLTGGLYGSTSDYQGGTTRINNSTFTGNTGGMTGGLASQLYGFPYHTISISNSIVAENSGTIDDDVFGNMYGNYNLIGVDDIGLFDATTNIVGDAITPVDPMLDGLANNGGFSKTHALLPGSPAINAANLFLQRPILINVESRDCWMGAPISERLR